MQHFELGKAAVHERNDLADCTHGSCVVAPPAFCFQDEAWSMDFLGQKRIATHDGSLKMHYN